MMEQATQGLKDEQTNRGKLIDYLKTKSKPASTASYTTYQTKDEVSGLTDTYAMNRNNPADVRKVGTSTMMTPEQKAELEVGKRIAMEGAKNIKVKGEKGEPILMSVEEAKKNKVPLYEAKKASVNGQVKVYPVYDKKTKTERMATNLEIANESTRFAPARAAQLYTTPQGEKAVYNRSSQEFSTAKTPAGSIQEAQATPQQQIIFTPVQEKAISQIKAATEKDKPLTEMFTQSKSSSNIINQLESGKVTMEQWVPGQIAKAMEDSRVSDADVARYSSGNPSIIQSIRQKYRKMTTGYTFTPEVRKEILDYMKGYRLALADQIKKRATGMVPSGGGSTWTESVRTKALEEIMRPYQVPLEAGNQKGSPETIKRAEELYNKYKNSTDPDMVKRAKILAEKHGFK
jgi:hypothetical protein